MSKQKKSREAFTEKCTHGHHSRIGQAFLDRKATTNEDINHIDYNINAADLSSVEPYATIWGAIRCGEENAIHRRELIKLIQIEDRILRKHIETLRRSGYIIAATEKGYFRPKTQEELKQYILTEESRVESLLCTISAAREFYASLYGGMIR